jgi:hypothetical protein
MANKYKDGCHLEDHPVDEGMKLRWKTSVSVYQTAQRSNPEHSFFMLTTMRTWNLTMNTLILYALWMFEL